MRSLLIVQRVMFIVTLVSSIGFVSGQALQQVSRSGFVVTSEGVRLHYLESGKGPAILFVPGLTMPAEIWEPQIGHFAAKHRVIAMDPRSQGDSDQATEGHYPARRAQDIAEMIDHLSLSPVILVGWSMGVPELLSYIDQFGTEKVKAIVFVDGFIGDEPSAERTGAHFRNIKMIQANRQEWTRDWVRSMFAKPQSAPYLQKLIDASLRTPTNTMVTLITNTYIAGDDRRAVLGKLNRPVLYTGRAAQRSQAEMIRTRLPGAHIEIFENAGHALFIDEAARFNRVLDEFIAERNQN